MWEAYDDIRRNRWLKYKLRKLHAPRLQQLKVQDDGDLEDDDGDIGGRLRK
jgi:hypothetical protein